MSQSSPILWIEVDDCNIADMIIRWSAKIRNPDAKAIILSLHKLHILSICKGNADKITNNTPFTTYMDYKIEHTKLPLLLIDPGTSY